MRRRLALLLAALLVPFGWAQAEGEPVISIIIDDIGGRHDAGLRAIELPGPVAYAFLPYTPYAVELAELAHRKGKEVMLHLPMQTEVSRPLGPGGVTLDMDRARFERIVEHGLAAVPHVVGVNNHMGSLLTRHPGHMAWLMDILKQHELFFIDSRTSAKTVAELIAREHEVPVMRRHVFLDHDPSEAAVLAQFQRLVAVARRQGYAIAIGHPYPSTLRVLEDQLPRLKEHGVELIPVAQMIDAQQEKEQRLWPESSFRLPTAAKN